MFSKFAIALFTLSAVVSSAVASPINLSARGDSFSLDGWGGHESLRGFDNFYGHDNFDSSHNEEHIINEEHVVCHTQQVEIVQQRLVVLQELAKKIITEQICEVETQTVVLEQWRSSIRSFHHDLGRRSKRHVGYDRDIVSHHDKFFNHDGSLNVDDWGFHGRDVGSHYIVPEGHNWDDRTSPNSVHLAFKAAEDARKGTSVFH